MLLGLNAGLVAEVVRKYLVHSDAVLPVADAVVVAAAVSCVLAYPHWQAVKILLAVAVLVAYGLFTAVVGHQNGMLALVGVRAVLVPAFCLILSFYLFRTSGVGVAARLLHLMAVFWLAAIGLVALLQLSLGLDHPINQLPSDVASDERQGVGDYTVGEIGLEGLFRPTSIFLHASKYGQVAFVLATYSVFFRAATSAISAKWLAASMLQLLILILSGQRAAILLFLAAASVAAVMYTKRGTVPVLLALSAPVAIAASSLVHEVRQLETNALTLVFGRVMSGVQDIPTRVSENVIEPLRYVIDRWALRGEGLGAFSLGSASFGGTPLYEAVPAGTAENSWLRLLAELGLLGLVLYAVFWGCLAVGGWSGWRQWRRRRQPLVKDDRLPELLLLFVTFEMLALAAWAHTHDVLGNVTTLSVAMGLTGVLWVTRRRGPK